MRFVFNIYRSLCAAFEKIRLDMHRKNLLSRMQGGEQLHLEGLIQVIHPEKLHIGKHVHIGKNAYINCAGGVAIGDGTILSRNVTIYSYDHNFKDPALLPYDEKLILKPVNIGAYVWIGMHAIITPGTTIGDGAVIGMGTVVSGTIPERAIVVNAEPRIAGYRDAATLNGLVENEQFFTKINFP
jgi:acetyltransferase-like isoleucine patch superfamily enzyme